MCTGQEVAALTSLFFMLGFGVCYFLFFLASKNK